MAKQTPTPSRRPAAAASRGTSTARRPVTTARRRPASDRSSVSYGFPLRKQNVIGIAAGIFLIVIGYVLMGTGITDDIANNDGIWNNANSITIAPILLTLGYCVIIPYFIFKRFDKDEVATSEAETQA